MIRLTALISLAACAACTTLPDDYDGMDLDGDGKADGVSFPTRRRRLVGVTCPPEGEAFKVAFFDADSTLRVSKSGAVTANSATDVNVLPFAAAKIRELSEAGYLIAVVSNQGGVAQGHTTLATAEKALALMVKNLTKLGARFNYFDFAERNDNYRKPKTGMAELLDSKLITKCGVGWSREESLMVGDSGYKQGVDGPHPDGRPADDFSNSDRLFAENLGIPFHEPTDYFGWREYDVFNIASEDELVSFVEAIEGWAEQLREDGADPEEIEPLEAEAEGIREVNAL